MFTRRSSLANGLWIKFVVLAVLFLAMVPLINIQKAEVIAGGQAPTECARERINADDTVTYSTVNGMGLLMDIYYPKNSNSQPVPAILNVHGGGWHKGNRKQGASSGEIQELVSRGYLVASIDYRLQDLNSPDALFPGNIEDVKSAVRYLRANAARFNIDPNRIGAIGGSAGGHLVSLLGTSDASAGFDKGENLDQSSRVQAVVSFFGPSDLMVTDFPDSSASLFPIVFGNNLTQASPVTHISKDDPPFLLVHGNLDRTVPVSQSIIFKEQLAAAGVPVTLIVVKNAGHVFVPVGGAEIRPSRCNITRGVGNFFDRVLRNSSNSQ